ncbi:hypothetical protein V9K67_15555 [Paraflavisolibacter sp. H34]|uniref:hypothetical protein n=1 Tax=Huijunlia imazamoxiresistens TaxID=3127457 RepID=UPI003018795A
MEKAYLTVMAALVSAITFAQEGGGTKSVDVDINTHSGGGGSFPWIWVVGGAVFILLLVALMHGGSRSAE